MINKFFILIILFIFNFSYAQEEIVQAGIKYNEASARIEAFKNVQRKINKEFYRDYLKDKNKKINISNIKKSNFEINDNENTRELYPFYIKDTIATYSVTYLDKPLYTFYYNILGSLIKFEITLGEKYPFKTYSYSRFGNLISVTFSTDENEQFIYNENGKLYAHWIGNELVKKPAILKFIDITRGIEEK